MWFKDTDNKYHCLHLFSIPNAHSSRSSEWLRLCTSKKESAVGLTEISRGAVEKERSRTQDGDNIVCKSCWFWDSYWIKKVNARKEREAEDQRRRNEAQLQLEATREEQQQRRDALVAANLAKGIKEVTPRHLIKLTDIQNKDTDNKEYVVIYLAYGTVETRHGKTYSKASDTLPPLPEDVLVVSTDSELGKQVNHLFMGDNFPRNVEGKTIQYEIVNVEAVKPFILSDELEITPEIIEKERLDVYEGIGRNSEIRTSSLDGGNGLGIMARDGGYGSYPLYDNYGDESDAEGRDEPDYLNLNPD